MPASRNQKSRLAQRSGRPMATDVSVQIAASSKRLSEAELAADACMSWFLEVDRRLSRFHADSELSALNRASGRWFAASPVLYAATSVALQSARASSGRFDPTLLPEIEALGYDRDFDLIAGRETADLRAPGITPPFSPGKWRDIELDPAGRRIRLPEDVRLDLGGIAKGWSADVAFHRFCLDFSGSLINVGGDLRAQGGPEEGEIWSIGIRDPRFERERTSAEAEPDASYVAILGLGRGGLATSGAVRRWWLQDGAVRHHLLNPETGLPIALWIPSDDGSTQDVGSSPLIATATALAPTAARAEVAAKSALLRGYPLALRAVEEAWARPIPLGTGAPVDADAAVALVLTFATGEIAVSSNLESYLATWGSGSATVGTTAQISPA